MFVGVGDALVKLFLEFVLFSVGIGVAAAPNLLDELFSLVVCFEFLPGVAFGLSEDRIDVLIQSTYAFLVLA